MIERIQTSSSMTRTAGFGRASAGMFRLLGTVRLCQGGRGDQKARQGEREPRRGLRHFLGPRSSAAATPPEAPATRRGGTNRAVGVYTSRAGLSTKEPLNLSRFGLAPPAITPG